LLFATCAALAKPDTYEVVGTLGTLLQGLIFAATPRAGGFGELDLVE